MSLRFAYLICILSLGLLAQDPYGRITGRVADSAGAVVPGAGIRVTNTETKVVTNFASDSRGNFEARNLIPGKYSLLGIGRSSRRR